MLPEARLGMLSAAPFNKRPKSPVPRGLLQSKAQTVCTSPEAPSAPAEKQARHNPEDIFLCDEESHFYSQCLEKLLVKNSSSTQTVIEFGSGDGSPVIGCLINSQFSGTIHGFELNNKAANVARVRAAEMRLAARYKINNSCFFKGMHDVQASCLIANPPYIPAPDNDILMPALHGGVDGANLTRDLMTLGFDSAILLLSSYANPVETLEHAKAHGYQVTDFMITPMPFGYYSSEPKVKKWILKMRDEGKAFCSDNWYLLAGVLFQKKQPSLPAKRKSSGSAVGSNVHVSSEVHVSNGNGRVSNGDGHISILDGHVRSKDGHMGHMSNGDGQVSNGDGHVSGARGHFVVDGSSISHGMNNGHAGNGNASNGQEDGKGDCSGLRHRYATAAFGSVNTAEDQLDELIKVMRALR